MKGFFSWFESKNKIKRWIFVILISMISLSCSIAMIMAKDTITAAEIIEIVLLFVIGIVGIIWGFISTQKRMLELLIKETDKSANVKSLIYDKRVYNQGPKIVVIGGGTGLNSILKGLKKYTTNITAIVTISGQSEFNTESNKSLDMLPLSDIKKSVISLAKDEEEMKKVLNYSYKDGKLKGLTFGDIFLRTMKNVNFDFTKSINKVKDILNITGNVLPVTQDEIEICAELRDGSIVKGAKRIPNTINEKATEISRIFISPSNCRVAPGVIDAIKSADAIVIGPGSLYTSIIPNLLVNGVSKAIKESNGFKIYVCNIMTEPGQTYNYALSDHIKAIKRHIGEGIVDYCIYDTGEVTPEFIRKYNMQGSELVNQDIKEAKALGVNLVKRDLASIQNDFIRHDPDATARAIIELVCEDLQFKDKQNNPEYFIVSQKLKYKTLPKNSKTTWKKQKLDKNGKSKFYSKYEKRIMSIRESDEKLKQKSTRANSKYGRIMERANSMQKVQNARMNRKVKEDEEKINFLNSIK